MFLLVFPCFFRRRKQIFQTLRRKVAKLFFFFTNTECTKETKFFVHLVSSVFILNSPRLCVFAFNKLMRGFPAAFLPLAPSRGMSKRSTARRGKSKGREKGLYARGHTEGCRYSGKDCRQSLKNEFPSFLFHVFES